MKNRRFSVLVLSLLASLFSVVRVRAEAERIMRADYPELTIIRVAPEDVFWPDDSTTIQPTDVGKVFYPFFGDLYDFVVVYPMFSHDRNYAWYTQAQNSVQGIGLPLKDISSWFDSQGRLLGIAFVQPSTNASLVLHELGHQWSAYARFCEGETLSSGLFRFWQCAPNHWMLVNFGAYGTMGGLQWIDNGDGTFTAGPAPDRREYLPISLYAMGFASAAEMPVIPLLELGGEPGWWQPGDVVEAHRHCPESTSHYRV